MKILHVIHSANPGGIRTMVRELVDQQARREGIRPSILFASLDGPPPSDFTATGAEIHSAGLASGYDMSSAKIRRVRCLFRQHDIVHFHFFNPLFAFCAIMEKTKTVYTVHGTFGFYRAKKPSDYIKPIFIHLFLNYGCHFISYNSEFTKRIAERRYFVRHTPSRVIYNGLDHGAISPVPNRVPAKIRTQLQSAFVVGGCGRLVEIKRFDLLLAAFAQFQRDKPDALLLIAGDGPLAKTLCMQAQDLGIEKRTIFAGFQPNVIDYQDLMDICVLPSFGEAFGLVALEALALGKPTLAMQDGGGVAEIIGACENNDVVDNVAGLTARLEYYYRNRPTPQQTEKRKHYAQRFDISVMQQKFMDIYTHLIEQV